MIRAFKLQLVGFAVAYCGALSATGFQLGAGGITPHYDTKPGYHNYCNQYGHSGVIHNRTYYLRVEGQRDAFTAMVGQDSICSPIEGFFYSYKVYEGRWFGFAIIAGGYHFQMKNWELHTQNTPSTVVPPSPIYSKERGFYFVPIIAPEFSFGLLHLGSWSLNLNSIVTPYISNFTLSLKKRF